MNFFGKLERKFGKYAISNLTTYIIFTYVLGYLITFVGNNLISYMLLDPYQILHGQVWRIFTWLLVPPQALNLFTVIMLFFYYSIGTTLERSWGSFRYNVYIFLGIICTIIGAFVLYLVNYFTQGALLAMIASVGYSPAFSTYYISLSIFLGFAMTYPDMEVRLYFILPIKIKYLALLDLLYLFYNIYQGNWGSRVVIISSLFNVILFFLLTRNYRKISPKEIHRKQVYRQQTRQPKGVTKHKCAICGRTEEDGEDLEFRFCSKCQGNYEYCQDHLFTHEHKGTKTQ